MLHTNTQIEFPGLGLTMDPPSSIELFGGKFNIHLYGIIICVGLILAVIYGMRRCKQFGIKQDDILDGVLCIVPIAVICARLYYCAFSWENYAENPIKILYIWEGGLAIYGGVIGAVISLIVFCKIKKIKLGAILDLVLLGFLIGQSIGRWGNFFNREAFGSVTDSFLRMGLYNNEAGEVLFYHPTFLYESLWNAIGFVALHFLSKKRQYDGQIALGYVAWYGLGRTFIEGLRMDSLYWGDFRVSQVLAALSFLIAAGILLWQAFRKHDRTKLFVNQVAAAVPDAAEVPEEAEIPEVPETIEAAETPEVPETSAETEE